MPVSVVPSSAVPVRAVPASTMRMRSAAATSPDAGGTQHLPSEERNEPWEAGAGHARGGERAACTHLAQTLVKVAT